MKPSLVIVEVCLCAPFSNATLERFFNQMNLVKTTVRNSYSNDSLNLLLRSHISGITLQDSHKTFVKKCVQYWYNSKNRRLNQRKRKDYQKRQSKKAKRHRFRISNLYSARQALPYQTVNILMPLTTTYNNI